MIYKLKFWFEAFEIFIKDIYESFISIIKVIVLSKVNIKVPAAPKEECVILGNGPSLSSVLEKNRNFLGNKDLFCVNAFPSLTEYTEIKPGNLVWLDHQFYVYKNKELLNEKRSDILKAINDIIEKTTWPLNLHLPVLAKGTSYLEEIPIKNPNVKICYFNYTIIRGFTFLRHFLFKANLGMPLCQNVVGASIFIALNMKFKCIYLVGADHNLGKNIFVNDSNEVCMLHHHFYDKDQKPIISNVFKGPGSNEKLNIAGFYSLCVKTFQTYYPLEEYAKYLKSKIYNATEGSFIDAFERKKIS
ncbi:MAG: hypothetical protein K2X86_13630 [Cytophagaceae bacterium]|nr:hypothetical protein [Cytophagaceae bacterium]